MQTLNFSVGILKERDKHIYIAIIKTRYKSKREEHKEERKKIIKIYAMVLM